MTASLENAARSLLSDPPWLRVFKNTYDNIEEQLHKVLTSIAAVAMAVRLASSLASGFLICIVNNIETEGTIQDYPVSVTNLAGPYHASLAAYAAHDSDCHDEVLRPKFHKLNTTDISHPYAYWFMKYGSVVMILQAISLILVGKMSLLFFPRMNQKLERFYRAVVEEALLGKDPDVAEDFHTETFSTDKVMRERQRQEICGAFRNSSFYYNTFMFKHIIEILLNGFFIFLNISFGVESRDDSGTCRIPLIDRKVQVVMQCKEKRHDLFIILLHFFTGFLCLHALTNLLSLLWGVAWINSLGLRRKVSSLITELQKEISDTESPTPSMRPFSFLGGDIEENNNESFTFGLAPDRIEQKFSSLKRGMMIAKKRGLVESPGKDFLFLFDLIAHTCGISATLRVLSFSAPSFEEFCQPRILEKMMHKTETSVTVKWDPASLQNKSSNKLKVDMYVATIFPGNTLKKVEVGREVSFKGLSGGTQEYIVTVSAMVNNAKMKGARTTFHLPPFPPQKMQCDLCIVEKRCRLTITWTAPRGDFHKYSLRVTRSLPPETVVDGGGIHAQTGVRNLGMSLRGGRKLSLFPDSADGEGPEEEIWLHKEAERHVLDNLFPGEMYKVVLRSMTGDTQKCCENSAPSKVVLTPPLPPHKLQVDMESAPGFLKVSWSPPPPPGHTSLSGYKLQIRRKTDDVITLERILSKKERKLELDSSELIQATEYMVRLQAMAEGKVNIETDIRVNSDNVETMFVLAPPPPTGLKLDGSATASQLKVKWDPPVDHTRSTYTVSIKAVTGDQSVIIPDETCSSNNFTFSRLDSGQAYLVSVMTSLKMPDRVYHSSAISSVMITKPLPPPEMTVSCPETQEFVWKRSPSQAVSKYEFKIKKDDEKATDFIIVDEDRNNDIYCRDEVVFRVPFNFEPCVEYKINVYSIVEYQEEIVKSEPLHMKSIKEEVNLRDLDTMEKMERRSTIRLSRSNTGVQNSRKSQRLKLRMNKVEPKKKCMSTPTTPVRLSTENLVKNFRKGSMGTEELAISPDQLEELNLLNKERTSSNSGYADSISSIEEEVEENQKTLTSAEGKMLAREWMAQSRQGSMDV